MEVLLLLCSVTSTNLYAYTSTPVDGLFDLSKLYEASEHNKDTVLRLAQMIREKLELHIVEFNSAIVNNDHNAMWFCASKMKPSVDLLNVKEGLGLIKTIEETARYKKENEQFEVVLNRFSSTMVQVKNELQKFVDKGF